MKNIKLSILVGLISLIGYSQNSVQDSQQLRWQNSQQNLSQGLTIGGYGQIDYNEPDGSEPGLLDVHRLVLYVGYNFNERVSFRSEIEIEHASEIYIEQAYLNYRVKESLNFLAGVILIPMGIVNEYHEPTTYYGVERPSVDKYIVPTTWREMGVGISGNISDASIRYQAYVVNGFKSFADGSGILRGKDGLRKGRQKAIEAIASAANFSAKLDYYGIPGLRLGLSGYFGKTQTDDTTLEDSYVGVAMVGFDARYKYDNFEFRGQYITTSLSGTEEYNTLTGKDLGSKMYGYYGEVAYSFDLKGEEQLTPFLRYENYNTQAEMAGSFVANDAYDKNELFFGLNYKVAQGAAFKIDYQLINNAVAGSETRKQFNAGVALWF